MSLADARAQTFADRPILVLALKLSNSASRFETQPMFYVYVVASGRNGTLYVGHTDDLRRRAFEHRTASVPGFSKKYGTKRLVWYEPCETREAAKARELAIKRWYRAWKLRLIEDRNPDWDDLYERLNEELPF